MKINPVSNLSSIGCDCITGDIDVVRCDWTGFPYLHAINQTSTIDGCITTRLDSCSKCRSTISATQIHTNAWCRFTKNGHAIRCIDIGACTTNKCAHAVDGGAINGDVFTFGQATKINTMFITASHKTGVTADTDDFDIAIGGGNGFIVTHSTAVATIAVNRHAAVFGGNVA